MTTSKRMVLLAAASAALAACGGSDRRTATDTSTTSAALSTPVWQDSASAYTYLCSDVCGTNTCNCLLNNPYYPQCPTADPVGLACSPAGSTCISIDFGSLRYHEFGCDYPTTTTLKWTRVSTDQCLDTCGTSTCSCIPSSVRCSASLENTACTTQNATCYVVASPSVYQLDCLPQ